MEVMIKECVEALREIWGYNKKDRYSSYSDFVITARENKLKKKYGNDIFEVATERLKKQGYKR